MTVRPPDRSSPRPSSSPASGLAPEGPRSAVARSAVNAAPPLGTSRDGFSARRADGDVPLLLPAGPTGALPLPTVSGPARTAALAVSEADAFFRFGAPADSAFPGAEVVANPDDVNDPDDAGGGPRSTAALAHVDANAALEERALEALTPEQRAAYGRVRERVQMTGDGPARLALQELLLDGELPGQPDLLGGRDVLSGLEALCAVPLAEGVDRGALVTDALQELAWPPAVAQRDRNTCAPTAVEIQLLTERPAEYLRLLAGLASPEGVVQLAGGGQLQREDGTAADDGSERSTPQRLLEPALMEYANGDETYSNAEDTNFQAGVDVGAGLSVEKVDHLLEGLYGGEFTFADVLHGKAPREAAWEMIQSELSAGRTVLVGLQWQGGGHKVLAAGLEQADGQEWVRIVNPWGQEERLPRDGFVAAIRNVNYRP